MRTLILDAVADPERAVEAAARILLARGLVAFPTETVYGLGALGLDPGAVERIFAAKQRPHSDPLILHVADWEQVLPLVGEVPPDAALLARRCWPGPLTLLFPKSERVPDLVTAGSDAVAVRMPAQAVALSLIRRVGVPLAAPSANLFSRPSPTCAAHVLQDLDGRIEAVLDDGPTDVGVESTVLDVRGPTPLILRPGGVSREALEQILGRPVGSANDECRMSSQTIRPSTFDIRTSPGLLTRHYSPRAEVRLYDGEEEAVLAAMRADVQGRADTPAAVLAFTEDLPRFRDLPGTLVDLGSRERLEEVAQSLYAKLRHVDELGIPCVIVRTVPERGLGAAINDRLRRAASGRILKCE